VGMRLRRGLLGVRSRVRRPYVAGPPPTDPLGFVGEAFRVARSDDWWKHVEIDPRFKRSSEGCDLCGDASMAAREARWTAKTRFKDLVRIIVQADLKRLSQPVD